MNRRSPSWSIGENRLALGILVVLVLVTIVSAIWQARQQTDYPPLATFSNQPDGGRALRLWLEALDYTVVEQAGEMFEPPQQAGIGFVLEPELQISAQEWKKLDRWVEAGGLLLVAGERLGALLAFEHFGFELHYSSATETQETGLLPAAPFFHSPPLLTPVQARASGVLLSTDQEFIPLLSIDEGPLIVRFSRGQGQVILCAAAYPLTNLGLKQPGSPELALNLLSFAPLSRRVWFDEWHHGLQSQRAIRGPEQWLRYTPVGRSLLLSAAVIFLALVLSGRSFGRAHEYARSLAQRRAPLEHVTAIANLNRRAGHRRAVLAYHHEALKRHLGKRYRVNPQLEDDNFVLELSRYDPRLDAPALLDLLARLRQAHITENEMVHLAAETAGWIEGSSMERE